MPTKSGQQKKESAVEFKPNEQDIGEIIQEANHLIQLSRGNTEEWYQKRADNLERRRGLIGKLDPGFPFEGSSDIRYRLEENQLRKATPPFTLAIRTAPKLARFIPLKPEFAAAADDLEYFVQMRLTSDSEFGRKVKLLATRRNECVAIAKLIWDYRTEPRTKVFTAQEFAQKLVPYYARKAEMLAKMPQLSDGEGQDLSDKELRAAVADVFGWKLDDKIYAKRIDRVIEQWKDEEEVIKVLVEEEIANNPAIEVIDDPDTFTVPENTGFLAKALWIAHDQDYSEPELYHRRGKYRNVDKILETVKDKLQARTDQEDRDYQNALDRAAGITSTYRLKGYIRVREWYCWQPRKYISWWNGQSDDSEETPVRCVITYAPEVPLGQEAVLRMMEYPYNHREWPFIEDAYNLSEQKFYAAEGLPSLCKPFSEEFDRSRNAAMDRETITLSPPTIIWSASKLNGSSLRRVGQAMYSSIPPEQAIHIPQYPNLSSKLDQTAEQMRQYADEICGIQNANAFRGYAAPPTAEQVKAQAAPASAIQSEELAMHTDFWSRIIRQWYSLEKQFLFASNDSQKYTAPRMDSQGDFVTITPQHFEGEYMILCGADVSRTDPMFEAQKLFAFAQFITSDPRWTPFYKPFDLMQLVASRFVGHIDSQTILNDRQAKEQMEQQYLQLVAQMKAQMEMQQEKKTARGGGGGGGKNMPGNRGLKQIPNAGAGLFPKSVGV